LVFNRCHEVVFRGKRIHIICSLHSRLPVRRLNVRTRMKVMAALHRNWGTPALARWRMWTRTLPHKKNDKTFGYRLQCWRTDKRFFKLFPTLRVASQTLTETRKWWRWNMAAVIFLFYETSRGRNQRNRWCSLGVWRGGRNAPPIIFVHKNILFWLLIWRRANKNRNVF
jgi:hypothetical protein